MLILKEKIDLDESDCEPSKYHVCQDSVPREFPMPIPDSDLSVISLESRARCDIARIINKFRRKILFEIHSLNLTVDLLSTCKNEEILEMFYPVIGGILFPVFARYKINIQDALGRILRDFYIIFNKGKNNHVLYDCFSKCYDFLRSVLSRRIDHVHYNYNNGYQSLDGVLCLILAYYSVIADPSSDYSFARVLADRGAKGVADVNIRCVDDVVRLRGVTPVVHFPFDVDLSCWDDVCLSGDNDFEYYISDVKFRPVSPNTKVSFADAIELPYTISRLL